MKEYIPVYCTDCKYFRIEEDIPECEYENDCCICDCEDSKPFEDRPMYEKNDKDSNLKLENINGISINTIKEILIVLFKSGAITLDSAYHYDDPYSSNNPEDIVVRIDDEEVARLEDVLRHYHR